MEGKAEAQKMEYLKTEKTKITAVKDQMLGGIAKAQAALRE